MMIFSSNFVLIGNSLSSVRTITQKLSFTYVFTFNVGVAKDNFVDSPVGYFISVIFLLYTRSSFPTEILDSVFVFIYIIDELTKLFIFFIINIKALIFQLIYVR